jgi:hypothetical protein
MKSIKSKNVVEYIEHFETESYCYLVMELCETNLHNYLKDWD